MAPRNTPGQVQSYLQALAAQKQQATAGSTNAAGYTPSQVLELKRSMATFSGYKGNVGDPNLEKDFSRDLMNWQTKFGIPATGVIDGGTLNGLLNAQRFFREQSYAADPYYSKDPTHAAFMRTAFGDLDRARSLAGRDVDRSFRDIGLLDSQFDPIRESAGRDVNRNFESRGLMRSSGRLSELARRYSQVDRDRGLAEQGFRDRISDSNFAIGQTAQSTEQSISESQLRARERAATAGI